MKYLDISRRVKFKTQCRLNYTLDSNDGDITSLIEQCIREIENGRILLPETWVEQNYLPGEFYNNIFRPLLDSSHNNSNYYGNEHCYPVEQLMIDKKEALIEGNFWIEIFDKESAIVSFNQATILVRNLNYLFEFIFPKGDNLKSYSNATRNLLILVCTEFENQIKRILENNDIPSQDTRNPTRYSTND